jgi:hypothetical protein
MRARFGYDCLVGRGSGIENLKYSQMNVAIGVLFVQWLAGPEQHESCCFENFWMNTSPVGRWSVVG